METKKRARRDIRARLEAKKRRQGAQNTPEEEKKKPRMPTSREYFVRAVGEPMFEYRIPVWKWERYSWDMTEVSESKLQMRDRNPDATYETDKRRNEEALTRMQRLVQNSEQLLTGPPMKHMDQNSELWKVVLSSGSQQYSGHQTSEPGSWTKEQQESAFLTMPVAQPVESQIFQISTPTHSSWPGEQRLSAHFTVPGLLSCEWQNFEHSIDLAYMQQPLPCLTRMLPLNSLPSDPLHPISILEPANQWRSLGTSDWQHLTSNAWPGDQQHPVCSLSSPILGPGEWEGSVLLAEDPLLTSLSGEQQHFELLTPALSFLIGEQQHSECSSAALRLWQNLMPTSIPVQLSGDWQQPAASWKPGLGLTAW